MNTPYAEGHRGKPTRLEKEPPVPEGHCGDSARLEWKAPMFRRRPGALSEKCSCCRPPRGGVLGRGRTRPLPVLRRKGRARGGRRSEYSPRRFAPPPLGGGRAGRGPALETAAKARRPPVSRRPLGCCRIVEESPTRGGASAEAPGRRARAQPWKARGWASRYCWPGCRNQASLSQ